ncbi:GroES chaperonin family protein [Vibrio phage 1.031.O._10N.261.46.F8]|nr:GroES chaperonin family protein [Vibrio phage 1.031.O._10N.261.46.F8]
MSNVLNEYGINAIEGMNLKPATGKLFVKMIPVESKSSGGILLSGKDAPQENQCMVIALSDGQLNASGDLLRHNYNVMDHLIISPPFNAQHVPFGGDNLTIITESDILGTVLPLHEEEMGLGDAIAGTAVA